jgi:hypothetical protein
MSSSFERWGVKSATLTFGGANYEMAAGPAGQSETREPIEVTSLTDQVKRFIKGALKEIDEFTVTLYQKSTGNLTSDDAPATLSLAVTLENGIDSDASASVSIPKAIVSKVAYPNHDASGDRKATYDVTFRPDGSQAQSGT